TIEQLIDLEARQAGRLSASGKPADIAQAQQLADMAIERGVALVRLGSDGGASAQALLRPNLERQSILGSAYKRKAIVLARDGAGWDVVRAAIALARDAYAAGDAGPEMPGWNPYARINRLQLDALLGDVPADDEQAAACLHAARTRFQSRYDFFDGAMAG